MPLLPPEQVPAKSRLAVKLNALALQYMYAFTLQLPITLLRNPSWMCYMFPNDQP
jgi:hypothetical protein